MFDLDDLAQLAFSDRHGWLTRAAQFETRWQSAMRAGEQMAHGYCASPEKTVGLLLPYRLQGVGRAIQALYASMPNSLILHVWEPSSLPAPGDRLVMDLCNVGPTHLPRVIPDTAIAVEAHPSTLFLTALSCLDQLCGLSMAEQAVSLLSEQSTQLQRWATAVPGAQNSMKQLAQRLNDRQPVFWSTPLFDGIAWDWWQRYQLYAESKAEWLTAQDIRHVAVMARFPRYWPQAGVFVRLQGTDDQSLPWLAGLEQLWQIRRMQSLRVDSMNLTHPAAAMLYFCEAGEWLALYAAALLGIDAREQTALDYLDAQSTS